MVYSSTLVALSSSTAADPSGERVKGMPVVRVPRLVWIPLVLLMGCGGPTLSQFHGIFGSVKRPSYADTLGGAVADISHFDANSAPQKVDRTRLPWSLKITTTLPAAVGNIVAGDVNGIGYRIAVDGEVKAERISNEVNAYIHCLVKGA